MRIRLAIPDQHISAPILDAALEATTLAAQAQQASGQGPLFTDLLRQGVKWKPEPYSDGEHFDLPSVIGDRGWGDCDDLAPALAAEMRRYDPGARARVVRSGPERWHAIVQLSNGQILDPSKMAGMRSSRGVVGAIARPMCAVGESGIAMAPRRGEWWVRTDLPLHRAHLSSTYHDRDLAHALDRSIAGAITCGSCVGWKHAQDRSVLGSIWGDIVSLGTTKIKRDKEKEAAAKSAQEQADAEAAAARQAAFNKMMQDTEKLREETGASPQTIKSTAYLPGFAIDLPSGQRAVVTPSGPIIIRF